MKIPAVRERVRVKGRSGTFLVVGVDRERQVVDLISATAGGHVEEDIPFSSLEPLDDGTPPKRSSGGSNS